VTDEKIDWLAKVLGVHLVSTDTAFDPHALQAALAEFNDAVDETGSRISELQEAYIESGDPVLESAAKQLPALVTQIRRGISVVVFDLIRGSRDQQGKGLEKFKTVKRNLSDFVSTSPVFEVLDENPFQVDVSSRTDLSAALEKLDQDILSSIA